MNFVLALLVIGGTDMQAGQFSLWHWTIVILYVVLMVLGTRYVVRTARTKARSVFGFPALLITILPYVGWLSFFLGHPPIVGGLLTVVSPIAGVVSMKALTPSVSSS